MTASHTSQPAMVTTKQMVDPPTPMERHRFHFLDALRGVAALIVMWRHAPIAFGHALNAHNSYLAVDFFFCLSGFVIAFSYEKRLLSFMNFRGFATSRIIRLWPTALLGASLGALELVLGPHIPGYEHTYRNPGSVPMQVLLGLFILPNISIHHLDYLVFPLDLVTWTLFAEFLANFIYAALVRSRAASTWVFALIASLSFAALVVERKIYGTINEGHRAEGLHVGITRVLFSFFFGLLVFRIYKHLGPVSLKGWQSIVGAFLILAVFAACLCDPIHKTYIAAGDLFIIAVLFPLIVYCGARIVLAPRWTAICAFFGSISYPLYILHPPLFWFLARENFMTFAKANSFEAMIVMLCLAPVIVFISWAVDRYYDGPIRRMLTNKLRVQAKLVVA